jgi:hypothetical protein
VEMGTQPEGVGDRAHAQALIQARPSASDAASRGACSLSSPSTLVDTKLIYITVVYIVTFNLSPISIEP